MGGFFADCVWLQKCISSGCLLFRFRVSMYHMYPLVNSVILGLLLASVNQNTL